MSSSKITLAAFGLFLALFVCAPAVSYAQGGKPASDVNVVNAPGVKVTNTPSVNALNTAIDTATGGRVTSTASAPRQMQFALKYDF
jgi:hypothetical protein